MVKKLTFEEFSKRTQEVLKAQKIFGEFTNNISTAFAIYQDILADEQMDVFISTAIAGNQAMTPMDDFERPKCPECGTGLRLKLGAKDSEEKEWNSAWVCTQCLAEFYSEKTAQEWKNELKRKDVE
jgi:hypothetical protein